MGIKMLHLVEKNALASCKSICLKATLVGQATSQSTSRRGVATKSTQKKNHYQVLQISESASRAEVRAAFVKLSKELHPDKNPDDVNLHDKFVALNEAYTVLSKPLSRHEYDRDRLRREVEQRHNSSTYSEQHTRWKMQEMEDIYQQEAAFRAHYGGQRRQHQGSQGNPVKIAIWTTSILVGLGTLYLYLGLLWTGKKLEEKRQKSVENYKILQRLEQQAKGMSRSEAIAAITARKDSQNINTEKVKIIKDKGAVS